MVFNLMAYLPSSKAPILPTNIKVSESYVFHAANQSIHVLDGDLNQILFAVNTTDGIVIYNPVESGLGGTRIDGTIQLDFDTTAMSDSDSLLILYSPDTDILMITVLDGILDQLKMQTKILKKIYG